MFFLQSFEKTICLLNSEMVVRFAHLGMARPSSKRIFLFRTRINSRAQTGGSGEDSVVVNNDIFLGEIDGHGQT